MSAVTEKLLGHQLSVKLLTTPSVPDWQPRDGEYHGGPYRLQVEPIARDRDMALLRIQVSREDGQPFVLHNLRVSFQLSGVDVHGSWDAQADPVDVQRLRMMPFGRGRMFSDGTVAANRGVPLKMLLHRSGQSRWLVGTVGQNDETRIDVPPDMRSGMYHIEVHKLPLERPPRGFGPPPKDLTPPKPRYAVHTDYYEEYIYVSRAQKDWYDAVQDYIAVCDEISGFRQEPIPDAAYEPVFGMAGEALSKVTASWTEQAARTAADLGFGTLIVDDGWFTANGKERGYFHAGDWQPMPTRFPDMAAHVRRVQEMGLSYVLWVAPFMVGSESRAS